MFQWQNNKGVSHIINNCSSSQASSVFFGTLPQKFGDSLQALQKQSNCAEWCRSFRGAFSKMVLISAGL